jgi:hypothetical protein
VSQPNEHIEIECNLPLVPLPRRGDKGQVVVPCRCYLPDASADDYMVARMSSSVASLTTSGTSCGRLWPATGITLR